MTPSIPHPPRLIYQALVNPDASGRGDLHRLLDRGFEFRWGPDLPIPATLTRPGSIYDSVKYSMREESHGPRSGMSRTYQRPPRMVAEKKRFVAIIVRRLSPPVLLQSTREPLRNLCMSRIAHIKTPYGG
jgi:hypothetical protein